MASNAQKIADAYRHWWIGKKVRPQFSQREFKLVKDITIYGPPSLFTCVVELIYDDGTTQLVPMGVKSFRPCKSNLEVEGKSQ